MISRGGVAVRKLAAGSAGRNRRFARKLDGGYAMQDDERTARATVRAREYRAQADAFRRLAAVEPVLAKRRLLTLSATRYDEVAAAEERAVQGPR